MFTMSHKNERLEQIFGVLISEFIDYKEVNAGNLQGLNKHLLKLEKKSRKKECKIIFIKCRKVISFKSHIKSPGCIHLRGNQTRVHHSPF